MNALILLVIVLSVFAMGYRFYARFLVLGVFRLPADAPMPAHRHADGHDYAAANRWGLLAYQLSASIGLLTIIGVAVGVAWGWVPAFLWIVVGTLVAAGTYVLACLWSSLREGGNTLAGVAFAAAGAWAALPLFFLGAGLLVTVCTLTAVLLGQLLQAHPDSTWLFIALVATAWPAGRMASSTTRAGRLMWGLTVAGMILGGLILGQVAPLGTFGELTLEISGRAVLRIPGETPWIALALASAYRSLRAPVARIARPRGIIAAALMLIMMLLVITGLAVSAPMITAPEFNADAAIPGVFPLLFIAVTAGALSGTCGLIAAGPTMRQLDRREDAPVVSFGGAMVSGALGVVVLVVLCAGFAEPAEWISFYGTLPAHADLYIWLDLAITKMGRFMAALGVSLHFAVAAVAAVVACMALGLLENTLRALSFGVEELVEDFSLERFKGRDRRARVSAVLIAASVFCALQVDLGLKHWLFLGLISQLFAGSILLLLTLVLYKHAKGMLFTLLPASFAIVIGFSGVYWFFTGGWYAGHWVLILATSCAGVLAATSVLACIGAFLKIRQRGAFPASSGMR